MDGPGTPRVWVNFCNLNIITMPFCPLCSEYVGETAASDGTLQGDTSAAMASALFHEMIKGFFLFACTFYFCGKTSKTRFPNIFGHHFFAIRRIFFFFAISHINRIFMAIE